MWHAGFKRQAPPPSIVCASALAGVPGSALSLDTPPAAKKVSLVEGGSSGSSRPRPVWGYDQGAPGRGSYSNSFSKESGPVRLYFHCAGGSPGQHALWRVSQQCHQAGEGASGPQQGRPHSRQDGGRGAGYAREEPICAPWCGLPP